MSSWLVYIHLAAVTWAGHLLCLKFAGERLPSALVTSVFYVFALLTVFTIYILSTDKAPTKAVMSEPKLLLALIGAGVTIGLTDYFFVTSLAKGGPVSLTTPIFSALGILLVAVLGVLLFKESLTLVKVLGFVFAITGIFLISR